MAIVNRVLHWLNPNAVNEEQRASIRRPANELVAYTGDAGQEKKLDVGDISSSGLFLRTDERWELGKQVSLSLQQNGPVSEIPDRHAEVEASTVRHAKDGMGLAFLLPPETSLDLWESAVSGQTTQTGPDYIVHEMRMAQATGVLRRICPEIVEEARQKLRKDFSSVRVRDAIRIILMADQMLRSNYNDRYLKAPAALVAQIIEMGSWASEEWQQQQWAGLLATSCSRDGNDLSNAELINLLGQLAHVHVRILETACSQQADSPGSHADPPSIAIQDLARLQDLSNMTRLLRAVAEMVEHRLLSPLKRSLTDAQDESSTVTVTPLGMRMFARCHGRRDH